MVKSKAQAIHNIQLSLQALEKIHNFPVVEYLAEDLFSEKRYMQELFRLIQSVFDLQLGDVRGGRPSHVARNRRLLAKRLPGRRSSSAPPALEDALKTTVPTPSLIQRRGEPKEFFRQISPSKTRPGDRKISPEPNVRRNIPKPTPMTTFQPSQRPNAPQNLRQIFPTVMAETTPSSSYRKPHRSRSLSPSFIRRRLSDKVNHNTSTTSITPHQNNSFLSASHLSLSSKPMPKTQNAQNQRQYNSTKPMSEQVNKLVNIRQLEMMRERLLAQQRDRKVRRRSFLDKYQTKLVLSKTSTGGSGSVSTSEKAGKSRMVDADDTNNPNNERRSSNASSHYRHGSVRSSVTGATSVPRSTTYGVQDWSPPPLEPLDIERAKAQMPVLPSITKAQQTAVRDWLLTHGISVLDGEGGYYHADDVRVEGNTSLAVTSSAPQLGLTPLPLNKDRLRNGETLCLLFCYLEPSAAYHAHLFQLIQRSPKTIGKARANVDKALWLFRVRRSPPLPLVYLCQPDEIIKCNKEVLWGLLWEIMQTYASNSSSNTPYASYTSFGNLMPQPVNAHYYRPPATSPTTTNSLALAPSRRSSAATSLTSQSAALASAKSYHYELPYSAIQRRSLDLSLLEFLDTVGLLSVLLGNIARPPTILALETYLKDGTLLCSLVERVLNLPLPSGYHKHPHSYSQCVANILKCIKVLQGCKAMCPRYLYSGVEEDIARGQWDCILGLLEDVHLLYDTVQQHLLFPHRRNSLPGALADSDVTKVSVSSIPPIVSTWQLVDRPYLGPSSLQRGRNASTVTGTTSSSSLTNITSSAPHLNSSQSQFLRTSASTVNLQNPNHPPAVPAVFPDHNTAKSVEDNGKSNFQQYALLRNQVRLDKYASHPGPSLTPSAEPRIPQPSLPLPPPVLPFQPALDLRGMTHRQIETEHDENDDADDDNDVSFLFSPSQEEKRRTAENDELSEEEDADLIPRTSLGAFQQQLFQGSSSGSGRGSSVGGLRKYPSVTDMTAGDPAMHSVLATSGHATPASPDIRPDNKSTSNTPKSSSQVAVKDENTSILTSLKAVVDWLTDFDLILPLEKQHYRSYTGNPTHDYSTDNIHFNAALLTHFGKCFESGLLLARLVRKITHQEIPGIEKAPKTQAQRLNNIRKSLEMLAMNNKKIPLRLLSCEEELLNGDSVTILQLLEAIKKAYYFIKA